MVKIGLAIGPEKGLKALARVMFESLLTCWKLSALALSSGENMIVMISLDHRELIPCSLSSN